MIQINDRIDLFRKHGFFRLLESPALYVLAFSAEERSFGKNQSLFRKEETALGAHMIATGRIITRGLKKNAQLGVGSLLTKESLFISHPYLFSAIAMCDVETLFIGRETMIRVLQAHPISAQTLRREYRDRVLNLKTRLSGIS